MRISGWAALAAAMTISVPAMAQDDAQPGVISYPAAYFAKSGPNTALDMVQRLPGFTFERGVAVRGLEGGGGNVLIDGEPVVSKNDSLDEMLRRIPVGSVLKVEVIRAARRHRHARQDGGRQRGPQIPGGISWGAQRHQLGHL